MRVSRSEVAGEDVRVHRHRLAGGAIPERAAALELFRLVLDGGDQARRVLGLAGTACCRSRHRTQPGRQRQAPAVPGAMMRAPAANSAASCVLPVVHFPTPSVPASAIISRRRFNAVPSLTIHWHKVWLRQPAASNGSLAAMASAASRDGATMKYMPLASIRRAGCHRRVGLVLFEGRCAAAAVYRPGGEQ